MKDIKQPTAFLKANIETKQDYSLTEKKNRVEI